MGSVKRTGIYATEAQKERMRAAASTPMIMIGGMLPRSPLEIAHECALEQGLPGIKGYYGCDLKTGEFLAS